MRQSVKWTAIFVAGLVWVGVTGCGGGQQLLTDAEDGLSAAQAVENGSKLSAAQKFARRKCPTEGVWQGTFSGDCSGTWTVTVQNGRITGTASGSCDGEAVNANVAGQVTGKKFNFAFGTAAGECTFKGRIKCPGGVSTVRGTWKCGRRERGTFEGRRRGEDGEKVLWDVIFSPSIDVSVCGGSGAGQITFNSQVAAVNSDGTFHEVWSPLTPVLQVDGQLTGTTFSATLRCSPSGNPVGSMSATWTGTRYERTFSFAGSTGNVTVSKKTGGKL